MNCLIIAKEFFQRIDFVFVEYINNNWTKFKYSTSLIYFGNQKNFLNRGRIDCDLKGFYFFFDENFTYRKINEFIGYFS